MPKSDPAARRESVEAYNLETYAQIFSLTRRTIINNDLGRAAAPEPAPDPEAQNAAK